VTSNPVVIRSERRDEHWPPENLLIKWRNSHRLRIQSINRVLALTLTLKVKLTAELLLAKFPQLRDDVHE